MQTLEISDSAYAHLERELERAGIPDAVITFGFSRDTFPLPDEILRLPEAERDAALRDYRAKLRSVPYQMHARAMARSNVPAEYLVKIRAMWLSFPPSWQRRMNGWLLDMIKEDLVLLDHNQSLVTPSSLPDDA